jgi:antitoxin component YwqK of YwqJK toxin-antitoxin module
MNKLDDKGYKHGYWELYDRSDNLYAKGEYINGFKNGYWEEYYSNGKLVWKGYFKDNKAVNFW